MNLAFDSFNFHLRRFLQALVDTLPGRAKVRGTMAMFEAAVKDDVREPAKSFWKEVEPHMEAIDRRNDSFFLGGTPKKPPVQIVEDLDAHEWWPTLDAESKEAIWEHLTLLSRLSQAIGSMDEALLDVAGEIAESIVERVSPEAEEGAEGGSGASGASEASVAQAVADRLGGDFDEAALMRQLQSMGGLESLLGQMGGLGGMFGGKK